MFSPIREQITPIGDGNDLINKYYLDDLFEYYKVKEEDRLLLLQSRNNNNKNERYLLLRWLKRKVTKLDKDKWKLENKVE